MTRQLRRLFRAAKATSVREANPWRLATVADSQDALLRIRLLAPLRAPKAQSPCPTFLLS